MRINWRGIARAAVRNMAHLRTQRAGNISNARIKFRMRADGVVLVPQKEEDIQEARWMDAEGVLLLKREGWPSLLPVVNAWEAATRDQA